MNLILSAVCGFLGAVCFELVLHQRKKKSEAGATLGSITRLIFLTTQISALIWVFTSYAIAIYSTLVLHEVYTMAELSEPAITTILGVGFLKVLENIFEHNNGSIFGRSGKGEMNDV